jgi:xanthine dehydrogenase accessory factor
VNIYEVICKYLAEGKTGMLATVVRRTGSAPRDVGAKMFVGEDGKSFGTVGGGRLESEAYNEALRIMGHGWAKTFEINMDGRNVADKDMLCGGNVQVFLEPVAARHSDVYRQIVECMKKGKRGVVVTKVGPDFFAKSLVSDIDVIGDQVDGAIIQRCRSLLHEKRPVLFQGVLLDPLKMIHPLYVFGAGHVAQFVSQIARIADFDVTVIDDRPEFANEERFPEANALVVDGFPEAVRRLDFTGQEYVVILTRNHESDAQVLEEVVKRPFKYAGMIGSKRKVNVIFEHLKEKGVNETVITRVHAPIGIPINGETPQEIGISIVAQLVSIKNERDGGEAEKLNR